MHTQLDEILGAKYVQTDDETRVVHAFGKGVRDLVRVRRGDLGRVPDVVLYRAHQGRSSTSSTPWSRPTAC